MKVALAQINPVVGDLDGNRLKILDAYRRAEALGADLAVFPELAVTGYPPRDLLDHRSFLAAAAASLARIVAATAGRGTALLVGYPEENPDPHGRRAYNAAAFAGSGRVLSIYRKRLLPVYDVFDEERYFEPGSGPAPPVIWKGKRIGVTICEDIWAPAPVGGRRLYREDPAAEAAAAADLVANLSASPFEMGKIRARVEIVRGHAARHGKPFLLVNQVGGNDEILFDGSSLLCGADGIVRALARSFEEDLVVADLDVAAPPAPLAPPDWSAAEEAARALVMGLADYAAKCGFSRACLGLSGGVDSAVTAALAARALGPGNVLGVLMPSRFTSRQSVTDSLALAANLGIRTETIPIEPLFQAHLAALAPVFAGGPFDAAEENLQARIRGTLLMAISNKRGHLVLSTGNKSELSVGYCTLYGDMCGGLAVISDVPKTLVYGIARHLNREREIIPASVLSRAPTAELRENQKDADTLPPYETLDPILRAYVEERLETGEIARTRGVPPALVSDVVRMVQGAEYKRRQAAPGLRVTGKAFGMGRRMPIASRWREP